MADTPEEFLASLEGLSDEPLRRAAQIALAAIDHALTDGESTGPLVAAYDALQAALA